jgi:hypothetical protein
MAISGIPSPASYQAQSGQASSMNGPHKRGHHAKSITDVDAIGSSIASAPSATGKIGGTVDKTA